MTHDEAIRTLAVERYLLDEMSELERHEFETHYFECETCAADLRTGAQLADAAGSAAAGDASAPLAGPVLAPPRAPQRAVLTYAPLAAAAVLALVAGYQAFVTVPALRARMAPQIVAPLILTPATRGETPVVTRTGAPVIVLSLDVSLTPPSGELVYDVRRDAGDRVTTGRTAAPLPGTPLLLVLAEPPVAGAYVVTLREADGPGARESTYRFTVR